MIMPKFNELIGTVVKSSDQVLHQDFIERFAAASFDEDNTNLKYAALASLGDFEAALNAVRLNAKNILHTRETISVFEEPVLEKVITVKTTIKDLYEQQAGDKPIAFIVIDVSGTSSGKVLFQTERIWAVAGGFSRGAA